MISLATISIVWVTPFILILLFMVALSFGWTPDYEPPEILGGYHHDSGEVPESGISRILFRSGSEHDKWKIVIGDRVDRYAVEGTKILVARLPVTSRVQSTGAPDFGKCEYWVIDVATHTVTRQDRTTGWGTTECYGVFQSRPDQITRP